MCHSDITFYLMKAKYGYQLCLSKTHISVEIAGVSLACCKGDCRHIHFEGSCLEHSGYDTWAYYGWSDAGGHELEDFDIGDV